MNVTLVTGASGALGSQVVRRMTSDGHRVVAAERGAGLTLTRTDNVRTIRFDMASPEAWQAAVAQVVQETGPITGAVLAAGAWQGGGDFSGRTDDTVWDAMMAANLASAHRALRAVLPGMVARGVGSVVVVGSRAGVRPDTSAGAAEYAASKAAVTALVQTISAEVVSKGVRINVVMPSTMDTPGNRKAQPNVDPARWVTVESVADVVAFLLSPSSRDVSGATLPVYGKT